MVFGPIAMISTPRAANSEYPDCRRANDARQNGHMNPRRKYNNTILFPRKSESRTTLSLVLCNSKSGASSPGVINLLIESMSQKTALLHPRSAPIAHPQKSQQRYHQTETRTTRIVNDCLLRPARTWHLRAAIFSIRLSFLMWQGHRLCHRLKRPLLLSFSGRHSRDRMQKRSSHPQGQGDLRRMSPQ